MILSIVLIVSNAQISFAADTPQSSSDQDILLVLQREGLTDLESQRILEGLKATHRPYSAEKLEDLFDWFWKHGVERTKHLNPQFVWIVPLSIKNNINPTFYELRDHWGIGIAEIEKNPRLLAASLPKLQKLRALLFKIAQLAGDTQFSCLDFTLSRRKELIKNVSAEQLIQRLKRIGAIRPERQDLSVLDASEKKKLTKLYKRGELEELFVQASSLTSKKLEYLARIVTEDSPSTFRGQLQKVEKLPDLSSGGSETLKSILKKEGYSKSDIEHILQTVDKTYTAEDYKNHVKWLKEHGVEDTEKFITSSPGFLRHPPDKKRAPKFVELIHHWGYTLPEIENSTYIMGMNLERVQNTRKFFDQIANLAGVSHFDLTKLSPSQRLVLLRKNVTSDELLDRLKDVIVTEDRKKKTKLSDFTDSEKVLVAEFYKEKRSMLIELLARATRMPLTKSHGITCELRYLRQTLQIQ
jgi:hypothetical protein